MAYLKRQAPGTQAKANGEDASAAETLAAVKGHLDPKIGVVIEFFKRFLYGKEVIMQTVVEFIQKQLNGSGGISADRAADVTSRLTSEVVAEVTSEVAAEAAAEAISEATAETC